MEWRHATWQCPLCRFKLGCCDGEPQESCEAPAHEPEGSLAVEVPPQRLDPIVDLYPA
jgi:hypothetical protein